MALATISPTTNGHRPRRPVRLEVNRHQLVGELMDLQGFAVEAVDANGAALELVLRLPAGPWRDELQQAHHFAHDRLVALLAELRMATGRYEGVAPNRGA